MISSLGKNPEREKVIDFSNAYAPFFLGVFGADAVAVTKADELAEKTIGVTRGAVEADTSGSGHRRIRRMENRHPY